MTEVINSLASRVLAIDGLADFPFTSSLSAASVTRLGGIDRETSRAEVDSQSMIALAPKKRSPMQLKTCYISSKVWLA